MKCPCGEEIWEGHVKRGETECGICQIAHAKQEDPTFRRRWLRPNKGKDYKRFNLGLGQNIEDRSHHKKVVADLKAKGVIDHEW